MNVNMRWSRVVIYSIVLSTLCGYIIYHDLKKSIVSLVVDKKEDVQEPFGGDFTLQKVQNDGNVRPFSLSQLAGKYVLLYFGYTFCPDICPLGLSNMSKAIALFKRNREDFVPVFITIDPKRDTPDILHLYASNFNPAFVFLYGMPHDIERVKKQYRVYAQKVENSSKDPDNYLVNHSSYVYLLDRKGNFIQKIDHDLPPQEMYTILQRAWLHDFKA